VNQQINLYQPIFRKQQIIFSAATIAWIAAGLLALLLAWSALVGQRINRLEAEHQRQLAAEQRAVERLGEMRADMPPSEPDPELVGAVEQLEARRENLHSSLQALALRLPARDGELLGHIDALARAVPQGLWLTGVRLAAEGQELTISGRALAARLVPEYLDRLSEEAMLTGTAFGRFSISASNDEMPGVTFILTTTEAE